MVLAVEPMVTAGRHAVRVGDDHWAIYSQDGSLAAHFEFTIAITAEGPRILTPWHEAAWSAPAVRESLARGVSVARSAAPSLDRHRGVAASLGARMPAAEPARHVGATTRRAGPKTCPTRPHTSAGPRRTTPANISGCPRSAVFVLRGALQRGSGGHNGLQSRAVGTTGNSRRERNERESTTLGQADVREVQDHPPERPGPRDLLESAPQAKARLRWHVSPVSTFPSTSALRSA